jgi:hypothetical protein
MFYYEGYGSLELRDANYWPDFPTSARQIAHIYQVITGRHLAGVVAVQPSLVAYLLQGLGPLAVPEFHETVTAANVVQRMEYYTHDRPGAQADPHRKRFVVAVNHALLSSLLHAGPTRLAAVLPQVERAFADRMILASVDDPLVAQALHRLRWDGALRTDPGDYLAVFDQSLSDSKLNPFVTQSISYEAQRRPDGGLDSRVTITYVNRAPHRLTWLLDRVDYQNYLRVAVPGQSDVHDQAGYDDAFWPDDRERGRKLVAGYVEVPDDATRSVTLRYSVPPSALAAVPGYRLVVQKQPGSRPAVVAVRVSAGGRTWTAHTVLRRDSVFSTPWDAPSGALHVSVEATAPAVLH